VTPATPPAFARAPVPGRRPRQLASRSPQARGPCAPLVACALAAGLALTGCNTIPVASLERSFTLVVEQRTGTGDPVPIDFLWVVDNSTSMCEEQVALARNFSTFVDALSKLTIDPRVAVTTMDVQCSDLPGLAPPAAGGGLNATPARAFSPACFEHEVVPCLKDADCDALGEPGKWRCSPQYGNIQCLNNPNDTVNTTCVRGCLTDEECQARFQDPAYICSKPSPNKDEWGCLLPPRTEGCPDTVGPILDAEHLEDFRCVATVGVNQEACFRYEQGLEAAWEALDPRGPRAEQAQQFLRPEAYLVILFITDEDDCSVPPDAVQPISSDDYDSCALLGDTDHGGPLIPVSRFVNRFKSLKTDPSRVIVAALSGDSTATDPTTRDAERQAFLDAQRSPRPCHHPYVCLSEAGKAGWGSRYQELTASFGANGIFANVCDPQGMGPALADIADAIVRVVNKVCLPRPILDHDSLVVRRRDPAGQETTLVEGEDYLVVPGGADCGGNDAPLEAIQFTHTPTLGEVITATYQGDPLLSP